MRVIINNDTYELNDVFLNGNKRFYGLNRTNTCMILSNVRFKRMVEMNGFIGTLKEKMTQVNEKYGLYISKFLTKENVQNEFNKIPENLLNHYIKNCADVIYKVE